MDYQRGYEQLKFYQDICDIRKMIFHITERFPSKYLRLISQMRDAARSAKQNIREGYRKGSLGEFLHSIRISQGSLEELSGDMEDCFHDGLIHQDEFSRFTELYKSAMHLSVRYLLVMNTPAQRNRWKIPAASKRTKI